jgi:hypothetical protein
VRGHQDLTANYENLDYTEQLNIEADREATNALREHLKTAEYNQMPSIISMLYHNDQPVTSKETETLWQAYGDITYSNHVTQREEWKPSTYATIWWDAHRRALSQLEENDCTRITKFINRILPTNQKLNQQDQQHAKKCPLCNEHETNAHVLACSNPK